MELELCATPTMPANGISGVSIVTQASTVILEVGRSPCCSRLLLLWDTYRPRLRVPSNPSALSFPLLNQKLSRLKAELALVSQSDPARQGGPSRVAGPRTDRRSLTRA
eukprot:1424554-Rhodomonas_salina.1